MRESGFTYYDFFAGGGMVRLGLGAHWKCLMANDVCDKKAKAYRQNFPPADEFSGKDVKDLMIRDLPGRPLLAWASFPCQDLSLAGARHGLSGKRSGTFWPFWNLAEEMARDRRKIPLIALENVAGAVTAREGADFQAIVRALVRGGYRVGALIVDAVRFVPQSRPRLFVIAVHRDWAVPVELRREGPDELWHPRRLIEAHRKFPMDLRERWIWWRLPVPPKRSTTLTDCIDADLQEARWHSRKETLRLISLMSDGNLQKLKRAEALKKRTIGTVYRRTRKDRQGKRCQRAEIRFDQVSGCLRTPSGGSSRQILLFVDGEEIRSRLLAPREAARLMGVSDDYALPENYNEAYRLMGDGVAVPVVAWLECEVLRPLALANEPAGAVEASGATADCSDCAAV
jgi:DNA (cytosine-5)-methyltransferase 1